ncbi:MAG: hypothetical protein ACE5OR_08365 [bacterium]
MVIVEYAGIKGDANNDNTVNIVDALAAVNILLGLVLPTPEEACAADRNGPMGNCDGDRVVNVLDAIKIVNLILGLDECP